MTVITEPLPAVCGDECYYQQQKNQTNIPGDTSLKNSHMWEAEEYFSSKKVIFPKGSIK